MPTVPQADTDGLFIDEICSDLGELHFQLEDLKGLREDLRKEFFKEATAKAGKKELPQKTVKIPEDISTNEADAYVLKYHPGYTIKTRDEKGYVIEEDPEFIPYSVVVHKEPWEVFIKVKGEIVKSTAYGYVVSRSITSGGQLLDDERLASVNPELWHEITEPLGAETLKRLQKYIGDEIWDIVDVEGWDRVLQPIENLTPAQVEAVKPFMHAGPKQAKLLVRYAKANEDE